MKKLCFLPLLALVAACSTTPKDVSELDLDNFEQRISYALGADMGSNFSNIPENISSALNKNEIESGFLEFLKSDQKTSEDCKNVLNSAFASQNGEIDTNEYSMKEISHCYGSVFGEMLKHSLTSKNGMDKINIDIAAIGFSNSLDGTDTLIELDERQKMIVDFNNDLNKKAAKDFISKKKKEFPEDVQEGDYILVTDEEGTGETIELGNEYKLVYTLTNIAGDTIISTIKDPSQSEEVNTQVVNSDDIVFPEAWKSAAPNMKIGGAYTIYSPSEMAFGENGLPSPNGQGYVIQPFSAVVIHSKVLSQEEMYSAIKRNGKNVIEEAKKQPNTIVDPSGYVLTTLEKGNGKKVAPESDVQANYILTNSSGKVIENSYVRSAQSNQPAPSFSLKNVVKGWQLAIPKMRVGGRYKLVLPYDLAYGEQGNQGIQPYETLTFEIEIVDTGAPGTLVQPQQNQFSEEQMRQLQEQLKQQQQQQ